MIYCVEDDDNIRELVIYTLETTGLKAKGFAEQAVHTNLLTNVACALNAPYIVLIL